MAPEDLYRWKLLFKKNFFKKPRPITPIFGPCCVNDTVVQCVIVIKIWELLCKWSLILDLGCETSALEERKWSTRVTLSSENLRIRTIMIQNMIMMIKRQVKVMLKIAIMTMMMRQICRGDTSNSGQRAGQASAALISPASTPLLFQTQGQHKPKSTINHFVQLWTIRSRRSSMRSRASSLRHRGSRRNSAFGSRRFVSLRSCYISQCNVWILELFFLFHLLVQLFLLLSSMMFLHVSATRDIIL